MAEIEEVPIEVEGAVSAEPSVSSSAERAVEDGIEVKPPEAPAPKKRGRPKGAVNKKPKPKARPPTPESDEETPDPPPVRRRNDPTPREDSVSPPPDTRAIAAEVLHLLSNRHVERTNAKREKYRSWFQ